MLDQGLIEEHCLFARRPQHCLARQGALEEIGLKGFTLALLLTSA